VSGGPPDRRKLRVTVPGEQEQRHGCVAERVEDALAASQRGGQGSQARGSAACIVAHSQAGTGPCRSSAVMNGAVPCVLSSSASRAASAGSAGPLSAWNSACEKDGQTSQNCRYVEWHKSGTNPYVRKRMWA
jgi:hypothetical protein